MIFYEFIYLRYIYVYMYLDGKYLFVILKVYYLIFMCMIYWRKNFKEILNKSLYFLCFFD